MDIFWNKTLGCVVSWAFCYTDHFNRLGDHHQEPATTPYSCHIVFTDRSVFSLNLSRIQIHTGTSVTNCNHKHVLMSTCRYDIHNVHVRPHCFILTEDYSCILKLAYFAGKISKNRLVYKKAVSLAYYGSCRLLVMGSLIDVSSTSM